MNYLLIICGCTLMLFTGCSHHQTPRALLAAAEKRYIKTPVLHFTATSMTEEVVHGKTVQIEVQGNMDFNRPNKFKLDWQSPQVMFTGSIRQSNNGVQLVIGQRQPRECASLDEALEGAAGVSAELSCIVPELLFGNTSRLNFIAMSVKPDVSVNDVACYCLGETNTQGHALELAIDKRTLLIQQIIEAFVINHDVLAKLAPMGQLVADIGDVQMTRTITFRDLRIN